MLFYFRFLYIFLLVKVLPVNLNAQELVLSDTQIVIQEVKTRLKAGLGQGVEVVIPNGDKKVFRSVWKKDLKRYGAKVKRKRGELHAEEAQIVYIADVPVNIYVGYEQSLGKLVLLFLFQNAADESFINASLSGEQGERLKQFLRRIALQTANESVDLAIKAEEKKLKRAKNNLTTFEKREARLKKNISTYEKRIEDAKQEITQKQADQVSEKETIESLKNAIEALRRYKSKLK